MELTINNKKVTVNATAEEPLLFVVRDQLDLTGSKPGCGEGQCGACTMLVDGNPIRSCIFPVGGAIGKKVTTIEGLAQNGKLHPVQKALLDVDVFQCSFCAPGMVMSAVSLLENNPKPTEEQITHSMQGIFAGVVLIPES